MRALAHHAPFVSCALAVCAAAAWPWFNTFLSLFLAIAALVLGIVGFRTAYRTRATARCLLSATAMFVSALILLVLAFTYLIAWSAANGTPM
jgi:hypothetical protein